jgi:hypothetical protein
MNPEVIGMNLKSKHIALFLGLSAAACNSDSLLDPSVRPALPATAALQVDLSFFHENAPEEGSDANAWALALATVAEAEADMSAMLIPEALVRAASAGQGTLDGNVWRWPFSTTVNAEPYEGELRAVVNLNQHEWDLVVTAPDHDPALTDYLWAKAFTPSSGFDGEWYIADAANASETVVARSSWIVNGSGDVDLSYSSSQSTSWTFQRSPVTHVLTHFLVTAAQARVTWDADGSGSAWTANGGTLCWDANLIDVAC